MLARFRSFVVALFRRRRVDREMEEEWRFHLETRVEALVATGVPHDEAERRAQREFGDPPRWKEQAREARGLGLLQDLGMDVRHALRRIRQAPLFATIVIATLALAMGASLAIFTLIDRIVLRPVDVPDASRLVMMQRIVELLGIERRSTDTWSWASYQRLLDATTLDAVAASSPAAERLSVSLGGDAPEILLARFVSGNYLRLFGVAPAAGRDFAASDEQAGAPLVGMISHAIWRTRFEGGAGIIGRTIRIGDEPVTIIGIAPPAFPGAPLGAPAPDLLLPLTAAPHLLTGRFAATMDGVPSPVAPLVTLRLVGRLGAEASVEGLQAELSTLFGDTPRTAVLPLRQALLPFDSRADLLLFLTLLGVAVGLTMCIGAANVAGLMLARVEERRPELAIRAALGARRARLVRQLGVEVSLLALAGGAAAVLVARWIGDGFSAFALPGGIGVASLRGGLDTRTVVVAVALTALAAFVVILGPAIRGLHRDLAIEARRPRGPSAHGGPERLLLGAQVSLCVVLVFGTGLFARSLSDALSTDLGFEARALLSASVTPPPPALRFQLEELRALDTLLDRLRDTPGVLGATTGPMPLVQVSDISSGEVRIDGLPVTSAIPLEVLFVDADYFTTLGVPLVRGRDFTRLDADGPSALAAMNESAAQIFWGHDDPLGRHISLPGPPGGGADASVVGVVRDVRLRGLAEDARPAMYVLVSRHPSVNGAFSGMTAARGAVFLMVRAEEGRSSALAATVHRAAADVGLSVGGVTSVEEAIGGLVMPQRLGRALLAGLSLTALAVTLVGLYGFVSGMVTRRTKDVGVRLALGASSRDALYATMKPALVLVFAGLGLGVVAAWWSGRFAERFLYGISPSDPATLIAAVLLLGATAVLAALIPALRVLRIDPVSVLRAE